MDFKLPANLVFDSNLLKNYERFKQKIDLYLKATNLQDKSDERKIAIFLSAAGDEAIEVFNTFKLSDEDKKNYDKVVEEFDKYCKPRYNETYNRFKFFTKKQMEGESIDHYLKEVKILATSCNFKDQEESLIRDVLIIGIKDLKVQEKLLGMDDLTLKQAEQIARAAEVSKLQVKDLKGEEVDFIRTSETLKKLGIRRLLNDYTYLACFPLHEGRWDKEQNDGKILDRRLLYLEWAKPTKWMKRQPLNLVRKYFGDKIGLYFCWLGFYTKMLFAPALVGTLCFLYGIFTIDSDDNIPTKEICDPNGPGNITLCPMCDKACKYQRLIDSCKFARLTYLFDNPATVFFAIFMSLWATVFLELWRRKQSVIQWEWDLHGTEQDEEPRPEFETSVKTFRTNPVTRDKEPYLPSWSKAMRLAVTGSAVFFMLSVVLCAVLGTIIYRLSLVSVIYGSKSSFMKKHAKIVTSVSAAVINLIIIMCLTRFYHRLAIYLTNLESPRTQTDYEDSYTFKIFLFEFMNFYSSLIYIAFFKGRFFDYPGDTVVRRSEFFRVKGDICDPAGCLSELCIQLSIIMIGKQIFNNFIELFNPAFYNWWRYRTHRSNTKDLTRKHTRWEEDYHLQDPGRLALFDEYLEMILQYGFVTLFVAAFPLAPLCALLNNIAEIRLDAYKMVTQARRPLAERVEDIGAWYGILRAITYAAVVSNGFVIAYTSDFIPRMVYQYKYSLTEDLTGYIDASLSVFNTSHYREDMLADDENSPDTCQYRGYRNGPNETDPYGLSPQYWHVFAARLAFVVVFEHVVFALVGIMQYVIPDVPSELKTQMQREAMLAKEAKYEHGLKKNDYDYDELLHAFRENNNGSRGENRIGFRGSWARRLSRLSDGLDAHVDVVSRKKTNVENTVWENSY